MITGSDNTSNVQYSPFTLDLIASACHILMKYGHVLLKQKIPFDL